MNNIYNNKKKILGVGLILFIYITPPPKFLKMHYFYPSETLIKNVVIAKNKYKLNNIFSDIKYYESYKSYLFNPIVREINIISILKVAIYNNNISTFAKDYSILDNLLIYGQCNIKSAAYYSELSFLIRNDYLLIEHINNLNIIDMALLNKYLLTDLQVIKYLVDKKIMNKCLITDNIFIDIFKITLNDDVLYKQYIGMILEFVPRKIKDDAFQKLFDYIVKNANEYSATEINNILTYLVKCGMDFNNISLVLVASYCESKILQWLIDNNIDLNKRDKRGINLAFAYKYLQSHYYYGYYGTSTFNELITNCKLITLNNYSNRSPENEHYYQEGINTQYLKSIESRDLKMI